VNHESDNSPEDFGAIERQLHADRPVPTEDELGRAKRRAVTAASARAHAPRGRFLSPARLAMVSLVSGAILVGGSGASLAVSGLSTDGSAGVAQYVQNTTTTPDTGAVAPSEDEGGCTTTGARSSQTNCPEDSDTKPSLTPDQGDTAPTADTGGDDAQETKQVASGGSDGRLPFTGLVALPLLLIGVVMLSGGFLLRLRTSSERHSA